MGEVNLLTLEEVENEVSPLQDKILKMIENGHTPREAVYACTRFAKVGNGRVQSLVDKYERMFR